MGQSSTFTYQGQLSSSSVAQTGLFDLRFQLFTAVSGGSQVAGTVTVAPLPVTNGLFAAQLTFGVAAFDGTPRWLEIAVRTNGSAGAYTVLSPRQQITATPYAVRAASYVGVMGTTNLTGKINDTNLSANVAFLTNNAAFSGSVSATSFTGNGALLGNLSADNLTTGTVADGRLSSNVAMLNSVSAVFQGTLSATNFIGYGGGLTNVPGRIFDFVPLSTSITATPNFGYLAQNDTTPVIITLPPTADIPVGQVVRVSASGAGGWIVAQNAGQTILAGNLVNNVGVTWVTNSSGLSFKAVAASSEGRKLVAATSGGGGQIFISTNYGVTWSGSSVLGNISAVASSADGTKLAAAVNGGLIYTSTDSGTTWNPRANSGNRTWTGIASTLDGNRLVACSQSHGIFISTDSGVTWPSNPIGAAAWSSIASSANGSNLTATIQGFTIGVSTNGGLNWVSRESNRSWTCSAISSDGGVMVAGVSGGGQLYTSGDYGNTWQPSSVSGNWTGVGCSSDGSRMIAVASGGGVYVSQDSGLSWQQRGLPTFPTYTGAACSSDGSTLVAVASGTGIYSSSKATTTVGTAGQLIGSRLAAVELQHVGNGVFIPVSFVGNIRVK